MARLRELATPADCTWRSCAQAATCERHRDGGWLPVCDRHSYGGGPRGAFQRGLCSHCGIDHAVTAFGNVRWHRNLGVVCPGSDKPPIPRANGDI